MIAASRRHDRDGLNKVSDDDEVVISAHLRCDLALGPRLMDHRPRRTHCSLLVLGSIRSGCRIHSPLKSERTARKLPLDYCRDCIEGN